MNEEKSSYFKELALNLQQEGFTVGQPEDGLLPVEVEGQRLCRAVEGGGIRYQQEDTAGDSRGTALERVIAIAKATAEYMSQMEAAPYLTASGLTGDYRLLAEFNDTVLAGHPSEYGMSFATPSIQRAMRNCVASLGTVVSIPASRIQQIHTARYFALQMPEERSQEQIEELVAEKMDISPSVVHTLLAQGDALLTYAPLEEQNKTRFEFGNPERVYEEKLLSEHLFTLIEAVLTAREQTLVRYYFGLGADMESGMTLEELAVRLNYNGPSGAQKALDRAIRKLRENFASGEWGRWREAKRIIKRWRIR